MQDLPDLLIHAEYPALDVRRVTLIKTVPGKVSEAALQALVAVKLIESYRIVRRSRDDSTTVELVILLNEFLSANVRRLPVFPE